MSGYSSQKGADMIAGLEEFANWQAGTPTPTAPKVNPLNIGFAVIQQYKGRNCESRLGMYSTHAGPICTECKACFKHCVCQEFGT